jgi:small GTP-binding protein
MGEDFQNMYEMTIGSEVSIYRQKIGDMLVECQLWDLTGQIFFSQVRSSHYSGTKGCLVVFDVTSKESFENIPYWIKEVLEHSRIQNLPFVLLGNKVDLRDEVPNALTPKHGQVLANEMVNMNRKEAITCMYMDTSAKTGKNVDKAFYELIKLVLEKEEQSHILHSPTRTVSI